MTTTPPSPPPKKPHARATGRITLHDVAAVAQVSTITASRALRGVRTVAPDLAARVHAAAAKLGYVPDPAARALASARSSQVVVLLPTLAGSVHVALLEALHAGLWPAGLQLLIGSTHGDPDREEALLRTYLLQRPAGIVLVGGAGRASAARRLIEASGGAGPTPCVRVLDPAAPERDEHAVGLDQRDAARALARHLIERDRHRIAIVGAPVGSPTVMQRVEGYREALREAGLHDLRREALDERPASLALGGALFEQLHERQRATDAILFSDDALAQGGLLAALRLHVRVPHQIAMAGFDDLEGSEQMVPPLTTVRVSGERLGRAAAERLLALWRGEPIEPAWQDVGYELVTRGSS